MQKFELILKNEKQKFYNRFALFIFILNGIGICVAHVNPRLEIIDKSGKIFFIGLAVILVSYQVLMAFTNLATQYLYSFLITSFILSIYWTLLGYWWFGIISFALILLYVISKRKLKVKVDSKKIIYPSYPSKTILWTELNNLILKDGLLSIDLKSNKIIQQLVNEVDTINEKEFNDFCNQQLIKYSQLSTPDQ